MADLKPTSCLAMVYPDGRIFADSNIKSEHELASIAPQGGRVVRVQVTESKKRSLTANALLHVWHQSLSGVMGYDILEIKQILKINFGFPILLGGDVDDSIAVKLKWMFEKFGWDRLTWPQKLKLAEMIPCTSLMTTKQLRTMMDNIKDWAISEYNISLDNGKRDD